MLTRKEKFASNHPRHNIFHTSNPVIDNSGTQRWFKNGWFHRTDGPAIIWSDGDEWWYLNGNIHRTNGPAMDHKGTGGPSEWVLYGRGYSFKHWLEANHEISDEGKVMLKLQYG